MANIQEDARHKYVLHYNPYSVCSLMVLLTLRLKGEPRRPEDDVHIETKLVDIFHEEQLSEHFLCEINKMGQVPVLTHATNTSPTLADSLAITIWLASHYPDLIPSKSEALIRQYLAELHALNYFSLSFPGRDHVAKGFESAVQRRLDDPSTSDHYRKALEFKLDVVRRDKIGGLVPSVTAEMEERANKLLASLEQYLPGGDGWLFGGKPTALDAHLVVFIARMTDVGRDSLIPAKLQQYSSWAMKSPEWDEMMEGRRTMIPK